MHVESPEAAPLVKLGILASHPIQYQVPLFRQLAEHCELQVFFAHRQTPEAQASAGFGVPFEWDVDLLSGYAYTFLHNVARHPDTSAFRGLDTPEIENKIAHGEFDVFLVMGWHLKCFWQAIRACRKCSVPVMVRGDSQLATPRGKLKSLVKAAVYPLMIRQFDACLFVGTRNRDYLRFYGAETGKLFYAPHCVDTHAFAIAADATIRSVTRSRWGLRSGQRVVLFVGKLVDRKRPMDLVHAVAHLHRQSFPVVLVWAGDGPQRSLLGRLGDSLGISMLFLGFQNQSQLPAIYRAADVLVLPSDGTETWGLVVNEAMACGTPCVVSNSCGCSPDMILHGITGEVFKTGDSVGCAAAIRSVLQADLKRQAIQEVSERFSVAQAAAGVLDAAASLKRESDAKLARSLAP